MSVFPSPTDLTFVARHQMEERIRDAQHRRMVRTARCAGHDLATATPLRSGVRSRIDRLMCLLLPFRRPDVPRSLGLSARAVEG